MLLISPIRLVSPELSNDIWSNVQVYRSHKCASNGELAEEHCINTLALIINLQSYSSPLCL